VAAPNGLGPGQVIVMISGRRPRRPDGQYYRQRRKTGRSGVAGALSSATVGIGTLIAIVAVVVVALAWRS